MGNKTKIITIFVLIGIIFLFIYLIGLSPTKDNTITGEVISDFEEGEGIVETNDNFTYDSYQEETEELVIEDNLHKDMFPNTTELHWDHMPLTYNYYNCSQTNVEKIIKATDFITNRTESITFRFVNNQTETPDISFICMNERKMEYSNRYVTNTFAEAVPYIYKELNIYAPSQVLIYSINSCPYSRPTTEIHEILHLLGLEHPKYAYDDIMNPEHVGCNTDITEEELEFLKSIYG